MVASFTGDVPSALVMAHPGHELFVSSWLRQAQPCVFVLTDGSGRSNTPRIDQTKGIVEGAGAKLGSLVGRFTDRTIYDVVLKGDSDLFVGLAEELCTAFIDDEVQFVVGDSYERKFLSHDICRLLISSAIQMAAKKTGHVIATYEFPLYGYYGDLPHPGIPHAHRIDLDEEAFNWKLQTARSIPDPSLQHEIDDLIARGGVDAFKTEYLFPVDEKWGHEDQETKPPMYEMHGEKLVAEGVYEQTIRYAEHVQPIVNALAQSVRPFIHA